MDIEIIGDGVPVGDGSHEWDYRFSARVEGVRGWLVSFVIAGVTGEVDRLAFDRDPESTATPLSSTMLRKVVPSELVAAASDPWVLSSDPIIVAPQIKRWDRPDEYLAELSSHALRLQADGVRRGRNVKLADQFGRTASQVSDDLRKCREQGWLRSDERSQQGKARTLQAGDQLLQKWEVDGSPDWRSRVSAKGAGVGDAAVDCAPRHGEDESRGATTRKGNSK